MTDAGALDELRAFLRSVDPLRPGRRPDVPAEELRPLVEDLAAMLDRLEGERREAARRQLGAQESERRDVAHRLHAEVGQLLTAALLQIDHARSQPGNPLPLDDARQAAQAALDAVQQLSRRLRPLILDDLGLTDALAALAVGVMRRHGLRVRRDIDEEAALALDREEAVVVLRVVRERLAAVTREQTASEATVALCRVGEIVELRLSDDGGDDGQDVAALRELVVAIGAEVDLLRSPSGNELVLRVPC